jgi:hypothetical protein
MRQVFSSNLRFLKLTAKNTVKIDLRQLLYLSMSTRLGGGPLVGFKRSNIITTVVSSEIMILVVIMTINNDLSISSTSQSLHHHIEAFHPLVSEKKELFVKGIFLETLFF